MPYRLLPPTSVFEFALGEPPLGGALPTPTTCADDGRLRDCYASALQAPAPAHSRLSALRAAISAGFAEAQRDAARRRQERDETLMIAASLGAFADAIAC